MMDATRFKYTPACWPVICRPSHDGWCFDTIEAALEQGAHALYVGLPKNRQTDTGRYYRRVHKTWKKVGAEGESMRMYAPAKS